MLMTLMWRKDGGYPLPPALTSIPGADPGSPDTRPFDTVPFLKKKIFKTGTDSSDFGLLGEQSSPKWEIPCPGRP